jgi:hypothetical protein
MRIAPSHPSTEPSIANTKEDTMKTYCLRNLVLITTACLLATASLAEQQRTVITGEGAARHVGETQTVRGTVADTAFLSKSKDQHTFLNLDHPFPNYTLTVLIPGQDRGKFTTAPEEFFKGKTIAVTGKIEPRGEKFQIVVSDPAQIEVLASSPTASAK